MKKYKLLNFKENKITKNHSIKDYKIITILCIVLLFIKLTLSIIEIKELELYVSKENILNQELVKETIQDKSLINHVKSIYSYIGYSNISEFTYMNNKIEVKGICMNLNVLDKIKSLEDVLDYSVENIQKEDDTYKFKVRYKVR